MRDMHGATRTHARSARMPTMYCTILVLVPYSTRGGVLETPGREKKVYVY